MFRPVGIGDFYAAAAQRFAVSPTIEVDGRDLEGYRGVSALACRLYEENAAKGWPSGAPLERRLLETRAAVQAAAETETDSSGWLRAVRALRCDESRRGVPMGEEKRSADRACSD